LQVSGVTIRKMNSTVPWVVTNNVHCGMNEEICRYVSMQYGAKNSDDRQCVEVLDEAFIQRWENLPVDIGAQLLVVWSQLELAMSQIAITTPLNYSAKRHEAPAGK